MDMRYKSQTKTPASLFSMSKTRSDSRVFRTDELCFSLCIRAFSSGSGVYPKWREPIEMSKGWLPVCVCNVVYEGMCKQIALT